MKNRNVRLLELQRQLKALMITGTASTETLQYLTPRDGMVVVFTDLMGVKHVVTNIHVDLELEIIKVFHVSGMVRIDFNEYQERSLVFYNEI